MAQNVAIFGAGSAIGRSVARAFAREGARLWLLGRDLEELERDASDLSLRFGSEAQALHFDALLADHHDALVGQIESEAAGGLDGVVLLHALMPEQRDAQHDPALLRRMIEVNFVSSAVLLERFAAGMEARGRGFLCAVTSVAGDRGRASNYLYGASKAALQTQLSGLRARLAGRGVRVVDVRPGFVDTRLTWGRPGVFLAAPPERVARRLLAAVRRDRGVVYVPRWWRPVMGAIRALPDAVFTRAGL